MSRLRLNQEYRNKIANRMRVHLEQENTQEKEAYLQAREQIKPLQDETWKLAEKIVRRHYTDEDVKMAYHLQNKFDNVSTIAKDSCFHFGYKSENKEDEDYDKDNETITKHFDFRLNGNINGYEDRKQSDFAYAYFRDELKGREGCNPDITIEMEGKERNPHEQKYKDANDKYLGFNHGSNNLTSYSAQWDKDYELDLIGREYCRDRQIAVSKEEFKTFEMWQMKKGQLVMAHYKWIKSVLDQMKEIKMGLKGYRYLDEAIELCTELGLNVQEDEVIRCNSIGLVIYNPKNLAERIKGMKNKNFSREDKIKARMIYEQNQAMN